MNAEYTKLGRDTYIDTTEAQPERFVDEVECTSSRCKNKFRVEFQDGKCQGVCPKCLKKAEYQLENDCQ